MFCGEPRGPPRGGPSPLGAVLRMGVGVLPRRARPGAPLLHLPRCDVRLSLGPPWARERGSWGVALGPQRSRARAGLERSVKRAVPILAYTGKLVNMFITLKRIVLSVLNLLRPYAWFQGNHLPSQSYKSYIDFRH